MKKNATSLTVDADVVSRARSIIEKSKLPFSVSKLVTTLLFEAFDAIEDPKPNREMPLFRQLRDNIHGRTPASERELTDEELEQVAGGSGIGEAIVSTDLAKPGAFVGKNEIRLFDYIREIVDKAIEERDAPSAKAAEPPAAYIAKRKPAKK